ncbi:MAG: hypothetical protein HPY85_10110 [Anaerolineae bacterium]|nr:hypothetical protein [Anaerolineae bacterium]
MTSLMPQSSLPARHILFDVDGVLITPGGYRKALTDTIAYFLEQAGLAALQPQEAVFEHFEALGITSEWDMVPLFLCAVFEHCCDWLSEQPRWHTLDEALSALRTLPSAPPEPDFHALLDRIGAVTQGRSGVPSEHVYQVLPEEQFPFPHLRHAPLAAQLLCSTRSLEASPTMPIFQQHILGSVLYQERYRQPASLQRGNYLRTYDHSPLSTENRAMLRRMIEQEGWKVSIYTARPSMPPEGVPAGSNAAFSPEAEQAQALVEIDGIHLSAYGKLVWLSEQVAVHADQLLKPSPVHALAAVSVHYAPHERDALYWAAGVFLDWREGKTLRQPDFLLPRQMTLHVFEDSPGGLKGGRAAADLLHSLGVDVELHLWGITASRKKKTALQEQGGEVFDEINTALRCIFQEYVTA